MMNDRFNPPAAPGHSILGRLKSGRGIERQEALGVMDPAAWPLSSLLALTDSLRRSFHGDSIRLCAIVNARSGACREDCAFCAQSAHHRTAAGTYPFLDRETLEAKAGSAAERGASNFSIVTSGPGIGGDAELDAVAEAIAGFRDSGRKFRRCASLGRLAGRQLETLRQAGLECVHHNLETGRDFFPRICTTHSYDSRVEMVARAKEHGLRVCSGGIFGLGESDSDRLDLAFTLAELGVDSVPLNFLQPVPGTPLEGADYLSPETCLRIIAVFRLVMPRPDIVIGGGRMHNLRDLHPLIFWAGANTVLSGDYLTTPGRDTAEDLRMIRDLGLEPENG